MNEWVKLKTKAKLQLNRTNYPYTDYLFGKICQG